MSDCLLVTGSSGLLGHAILDAAAEAGLACLGVDLAPADGQASCEAVALDFGDSLATAELVRRRGVTRIIHSAAISHPGLAAGTPEALWNVNAAATVRLLDVARQAGIERFVYLSSAAVYGARPASQPLDEETAARPTDLYGATKAAAEAMVSGYGAVFGLKTVILRPVSIYGPRRKTFSAPMFLLASALDGLPAELRDMEGGCDYIHVDEVARAAMLALGCEAGPQAIFNVATGRQYGLGDVADIVRRLCPGAAITLKPAAQDQGSEPAVSVECARRHLGFTASISFEDGMAELAHLLAGAPRLREAARAAREELAAAP